jgi:hypothetical protein
MNYSFIKTGILTVISVATLSISVAAQDSPLISSRQWALEPSHQDSLRLEIYAVSKQIPELQRLNEIAKENGARVFLIGGSVASLAHFSKWRLLDRLQKHPFIPQRLEENLFNFIRLDQDVDFVVDVDLPKDEARKVINKITAQINSDFPRYQADWQGNGLRINVSESEERKDAILSKSFFERQHLDSYSRILLDLSADHPNDILIDPIDLFEERRPDDSPFLQDILESKIRFYKSEKLTTGQEKSKAWNPQFMGAMRAILKASQFAASFSETDLESLKKIIQDFDASATHPIEFLGRLKSRTPKLVSQSLDLEYSVRLLNHTGLRSKLLELAAIYPSYLDNYPLMLQREPLKHLPNVQSQTTGHLTTAKDLGIDFVVHETRDALSLESITWSPDGALNAFISRVDAPGENANSGKGFYTRITGDLVFNTGASFKLAVSPDAILGVDFSLSDNKKDLLILNGLKFKVEHSSLPYHDIVSLWSAVADGSIGTESKAKVEAKMSYFFSQIKELSSNDLDKILQATQKLVDKNINDKGSNLSWQLRIWFHKTNPIAYAYPRFLNELIEAKNDFLKIFLLDLFNNNRVSLEFFEKNRRILKSIFRKIHFDHSYAIAFSKSIYRSEALKSHVILWQELSYRSKKPFRENMSMLESALKQTSTATPRPELNRIESHQQAKNEVTSGPRVDLCIKFMSNLQKTLTKPLDAL